jgi:hypothetical protein
MSGDRLPVPVPSLGPFRDLGLQVHQLMMCGRNSEVLALADAYE